LSRDYRETMKIRYAVYARTAAGGPAAAERQITSARAAVAERGDGVIVHEYRDVNVSGSGGPGPGLASLLGAISSGEIDVVVVTGLGRLGRSVVGLNMVLNSIERGSAHVITTLERQ